MAEPATRMIINEDRIREIAAERGLNNVEKIMERAREMKIDLGMVTIYRVFKGSNFKRETVEALAKVLGCDLGEFVIFVPEEPSGG